MRVGHVVTEGREGSRNGGCVVAKRDPGVLLACFVSGMQWVWTPTPGTILCAMLIGIAERCPLLECVWA